MNVGKIPNIFKVLIPDLKSACKTVIENIHIQKNDFQKHSLWDSSTVQNVSAILDCWPVLANSRELRCENQQSATAFARKSSEINSTRPLLIHCVRHVGRTLK